jgi:hypothetical protein
MHHSVCLKMTTLTSKEMLAHWQQHNPQFKETLRLLETDWPHALAEKRRHFNQRVMFDAP